MILGVVAALVAAAPRAAEAAEPHRSYFDKRSGAAVAAFKRAAPCPATGRARGACPGWIVDHVVPLCAGGADAPANMQWQPRGAALDKDRGEWRLCRSLRRRP